MSLAIGELIRRFLMHTLPDGFRRVRYYGSAANGHRSEKLTLCRRLLDITPVLADDTEFGNDDQPLPCPCCDGQMVIIELLDAAHRRASLDTS
ncbi:MAG: transposase [Alphaproteobacteria bacterium]|nr:transposase [Alphaproteobacteria bacterium]